MSTFFSRPLGRSFLVCALFAASALGAWAFTPRQYMQQDVLLAKVVPSQFGDWKELTNGLEQTALSVASDGTLSEEQPYNEVIMRTYENSLGERVMLALGYAKQQKQEVKIHRPEVCYVAQGFQVLDERLVDLPQSRPSASIPGQRLLMRNGGRLEAVTYWIRIGADYPRGGLNTRLAILRHGVHGQVPDAMLVRVSTILPGESDTQHGFEQQERFLADLVHAMPAGTAKMLVADKP